MNDDKKIVRFTPGRKPGRSVKKSPVQKQETKKSAGDGIYIFFTDLIEIIVFPFVLLFRFFQWLFGLFKQKR